ncbi:BtpA/SgcQ family protein [soil metagenome]
MVHVRALPGSPNARLPVAEIARIAAAEAGVLAAAGFDALLIENMHDAPYVLGPHAPVTVAALTAVALAVRAAAPHLPLGVQVLAAGNLEALAVAQAAGCDFIRCENFVFAHVADEGIMPTAEAGRLLRERRRLGGERIAVFADIQKKHAAHALTADVPIAEHAHAAEFFGADGVIVTGVATGRAASVEDLQRVKAASALPLIVGSGVDERSIGGLLQIADAVIVGSALKVGGRWSGEIDEAAARRIVGAGRGRN